MLPGKSSKKGQRMATVAQHWFQTKLTLPPQSRGFHLITDEILKGMPEIRTIDIGLLHIYLQHTSASLSINENADPDVPADLNRAFDRLAPENAPYEHTVEGPDDMPAHIKCSMLGASLLLPVAHGELQLGTWQGVYLCEHRNRGGSRTLVLTLQGQ